MEQPEFDPMEFIRLADALATHDANEAALRTAVGRLYYAVFLLARAKTGVTDQRQSHERVRTALSSHDRSLASQLGTLGHLRNVADYEMQPQIVQDRNWRNNWSNARRNARRILQSLEALPDLSASEPDDRSQGRR